MSDTSTLHDLHEASGKVREMYGFGDRLLMVASDRISAFDVVLPTPIPDKGRVLTGLSHFWFGRTEEIIPNHLITTELAAYPPEAQRAPDLAGRSMLVKRLTMMPIECVVRGYLVGLGMEGLPGHRHRLRPQPPAGHGRGPEAAEAASSRPSTKATDGHDQNIDRDARRAPGRRGALRPAGARCRSSSTRRRPSTRSSGASSSPTPSSSSAMDETGAARAGRRGAHARLVAVLAGRRVRHRRLAAVLRQAVRARLARDPRLGQDAARAPSIPDDVVAGTRARYVEAYERLTGGSFDAYLAAAGGSR